MFAIQLAKHLTKSLVALSPPLTPFRAASNNLTARFANSYSKDCALPPVHCGTERMKTPIEKHFAKSCVALSPLTAFQSSSNNMIERYASNRSKDCTSPSPCCGTEMINKIIEKHFAKNLVALSSLTPFRPASNNSIVHFTGRREECTPPPSYCGTEMIKKLVEKRFTKSLAALSPLTSFRPTSNILTVRFASRSKDCTPPPPRCGTEMIKKLIADGCRKTVKKADYIHKPPPFKSMWENPECCKQPCPDAMVRFDELYYQPSDKSKKVYRQTWVECPEKRIVRKAICDFRNLKYPQLERRPRKIRPKTACEIRHTKMECRKKVNPQCLRICMPGCKGSRLPPKCHFIKPRVKCKKICCPYPAYSECSRKKPKPLRRSECFCVGEITTCDAFAVMRKRLNIKGGYTPL